MFRLLALTLLLTTVGCGDKKNPADSKLAKLCVDASAQLAKGGGDAETFQMQLSNAFQACSGGCDDGNKASCASLESHVAKLCGVATSACESLCKSVKSPSLKKTTCDFKPAPPVASPTVEAPPVAPPPVTPPPAATTPPPPPKATTKPTTKKPAKPAAGGDEDGF